MPRAPKVPSYRHHKPSGRAVATFGGKVHYLGPWESRESRNAYHALVAEWHERNQQLPHRPPTAAGITIGELILAYLKSTDESPLRRPDGTPRNEFEPTRVALRPLSELYRHLPAGEFAPLKLKMVRKRMTEDGRRSRGYINRQVTRILRMFRWGAANGLLSIGIFNELKAVEGLRIEQSNARETNPVDPVPQALIDAVLPLVSRQVRAMIELQLLTGMRPGEVCMMRTADIITSAADIWWKYTPATHKTAHRGHSREIFIGPRAQEILRPWLRPPAEGAKHLFSPMEAEAERLQAIETAARAKGHRPTPSQRMRAHWRRRRRMRDLAERCPGERYSVNSYRGAIRHACMRAFELPAELGAAAAEARAWCEKWRYAQGRQPRQAEMPAEIREKLAAVNAFKREHVWHPHQLRHNAATELAKRSELGIDAARVVLGHRNERVTERYVRADREKAARIMGEVG